MRIWTTRGNESQGQFALDTSLALLKYFNQYFGIDYPLPKMDHIALPDFAAGAMENWGAITYKKPPYWLILTIFTQSKESHQ